MMKNQFFIEKINKIREILAKITQEKRELTQYNVKKKEPLMFIPQVGKTMRKNYEQPCIPGYNQCHV